VFDSSVSPSGSLSGVQRSTNSTQVLLYKLCSQCLSTAYGGGQRLAKRFPSIQALVELSNPSLFVVVQCTASTSFSPGSGKQKLRSSTSFLALGPSVFRRQSSGSRWV
jgi:hypothetical protein